MTTTPLVWTAPFIANATKGTQLAPQTIGLANGNILVVWQDGTAGTGTGWDIMGAIYSPTGSLIGQRFQVNQFLHKDAQTEPKIVALPDGGWVMAYASLDLDSDVRFLVIERFNSSGGSTNVDLLLNPAFVQPPVTWYDSSRWELAVDAAGNYTVAFHVQEEGEGAGVTDVHAYHYTFAGDERSEEHTRTVQNEPGDDDILGAVATFANGDIIAVSHEPDLVDGEYLRSAEIRITAPDGTPLTSHREFGPTFHYSDNKPKDVAVLADDRFVIVSHIVEPHTDGYHAYFAVHIGSRDGSNNITVGALQRASVEKVVDLFPVPFIDPDASVVALQDGGFFVAWADYDSPLIRGTRYDANGAVVGTQGAILVTDNFVPAGDNPTFGELSLTVDGRILMTYRNAAEEITEVILDPRENVIFGDESSEVITALPQDTLIQAAGGADRLYGHIGIDILLGDTGNDTITGGPSGDNIQGGADNDQLYGDQGNDLLTGGAGDDYLDGDLGNDSMNGGAGADTLRGGTGDDTYTLNSIHRINEGGSFRYVYDTVIETQNGGTDTIIVSWVSDVGQAPLQYTLGENIENGVIGGDVYFALYGNGLDNVLTGNAGANVLYGGEGVDTMAGGAGDDFYDVDRAGDRVIELVNGGSDRVLAVVNYTLTAHVETLHLLGLATKGTGNGLANTIYSNEFLSSVLKGLGGADTLSGASGDDELDGGTGADYMSGGSGNDTYFVDAAGDTVSETVESGGRDLVFSTVDFTLGTFVEDLRLRGTAALDGNGNAGANRIDGNLGANLLRGLDGNDRLFGNDGADTLVGGLGNDTMTGGAHADIFRFAANNSGADRITDFQRSVDRFELGRGAFTNAQIAGADTILTYSGGTIRIEGVTNLTLDQWNALVVPSGSSAFGPLDVSLWERHGLSHPSHGDWAYA